MNDIKHIYNSLWSGARATHSYKVVYNRLDLVLVFFFFSPAETGNSSFLGRLPLTKLLNMNVASLTKLYQNEAVPTPHAKGALKQQRLFAVTRRLC